MKSKFILVSCIPLLFLSGCGSNSNFTENASSFTSSEQPSSSGEKTTKVTKGLIKLKEGFKAKMTYIASNSSFSSSVAKEIVLISTTNKQIFASRDLAFDSHQEIVDNGTPFEFFSRDSKGLLYKEGLNSKNNVINDYRFSNGAYYDSVYSNPFEVLDENNLNLNDEGDYNIPVSFSRYLVTFFGLDVSSFQDRELEYSTISFLGADASKIELKYKAKETYAFSFALEFEETGEFEFTERQPYEDDGTDKTKLKSAFEKLSGKNYTMALSIKGGSMNLISSRKWKLYFQGEKIFVDQDLFSSIPGLSDGDYLLQNDATDVFSAYIYDSDRYLFKKAQERVSYDDELMDTAPSMDFFTLNRDSTYTVPSSLAYCLFDALEPKLARFDLYTLGATGISVSLDDNILPVITSTFEYSTGLTDIGTVVISFSNVGTTELPEYVANSISQD
ncbi:MAG: hypothetical protein WCR67_07060 [Bacilli bacterium]